VIEWMAQIVRAWGKPIVAMRDSRPAGISRSPGPWPEE